MSVPNISDTQMSHPRWSNGADYGQVSRLFHWSTAILMAANVALGLYSMSLPRVGALRDTVLVYHKSIGMFVLAWTVVRLGWLRYSPARLNDGNLRPWEILAARFGHALLYLVLLLMPLSGLIMSIGAGRPTTFFYLVTIPQFLPIAPGVAPHDQYFYRLGRFLHEDVLQWVVYAAFAAHMAGVIKHQFIDGDRNFIRRMWGRPGG